jgi:hypothetical protein
MSLQGIGLAPHRFLGLGNLEALDKLPLGSVQMSILLGLHNMANIEGLAIELRSHSLNIIVPFPCLL